MFIFSSTVKSRSLVRACGITPIVRRTASGSRATSCPSTRTAPAVIGISVVIIRINVDFPAPFGPSSPKISPSFTANEISSTAVNAPYRLTIRSTSIASGASAAISLRPLNSEGAIPPPLALFTSTPFSPGSCGADTPVRETASSSTTAARHNPCGGGRPRPSLRAKFGSSLLLPRGLHASLQLLRTHQHFRCHPRHIRALRILQLHLQRNRPDVALPPSHVALRRKIRFRRLVENPSPNPGSPRPPHPQRVRDPNMIGFCFRNRPQHPRVAEIHNGHDRLPRIDHFAFAGRAHQHRPCYGRINLRVSQANLGFLQLRHRVIHLCPRRCHRTLSCRRLIRSRNRRIQVRLTRRHLIPQRLHARLSRLQIHLRLHLLLL